MTPPWLDETLYPDVDPPEDPLSEGDRIDFLARLCGAWDFGIPPDPRTIDEVRQPRWRATIEVTNMLTSPTYHLLRGWHGLPEAPYLGDVPAYIRDDPNLHFI